MAKKKTIKVPARKNRVLVSFIQDVSGSMAGNWAETCDGFKTFIDSLKSKEDVDYIFSLTLFNTQVDKRFIGVSVHNVASDYMRGVIPDNGTALFDAVGDAIQDATKLESEVDKVIYVIVTDGLNNASTVWTKEALHSVIDGKLSGNKSTFQYLGCQPESWDEGASIGLVGAQTLGYNTGRIGETYACVADAANNFSASSATSSRGMTTAYASSSLLKSAGLTIQPDIDITVSSEETVSKT